MTEKKCLKNYPKMGSVLWVGEPGVEMENLRDLALQYARELLCESSPRSAALLDADNHPDFIVIAPETDKHVIKIDKIRELIEWSTTKPSIATIKIAILEPADSLNLQAANALLKTLEEPPDNTLFLLITKYPSRLPTTLQGRCHTIRHRNKDKNPKPQLLQDPMRLQLQNDLQALKSNQDEPVSIAARWLKNDVHQVFYWLMIILCEFTNNHTQDEQVVRSRRWWRFLDEVLETKRSLEERAQANVELLVETLLIQYARIMAVR